MNDAGQVLRFVLDRIAQIYQRPLMYGGTPESVDNLLYYYHELWAEILERREEFESVYRGELEREGCGNMHFAGHYRHRRRPGAEDGEATDFVVRRWLKVSGRLGIALPRAEIAASLRRSRAYRRRMRHWIREREGPQ